MRRIALLLLTCAALTALFAWFAPATPRGETFVEIAPGTPSRRIARQLQSQHVIWSQTAFDAMRLFRHGTLKAGEYRFNHPARLGEVYNRLVRGDVYTISVTVPEGANIFDIGQRVGAAHLAATTPAFLKAAETDTVLIRDLDPTAPTLEGYLFPDTYQFPRTATANQIAAAMVKRFRRAATDAHLLPANPHAGQTYGQLHRIVTLASLIERETPIDAERPIVASVFVNRLARDMPLMTDPAVIYAALLQGRYRGTIFASDLAADSPYNTYKHPGLPPSPICNPGLASLKAAAAPAQTNYLYFVAASQNPSGHSRFAATLEEHQRNVAEYRKAASPSPTPVPPPTPPSSQPNTRPHRHRPRVPSP